MDPTVEPKNLVSDVWFRVERNKRLSDCDWTQVNDCQLSETKIQEWKVYRQALRDLPETTTPSFDEHRILTGIHWPTPPDAEFPELKTRLQTIETQANSAIQILSEFGVSGLMDPIDTSTWPTTKSAKACVDVPAMDIAFSMLARSVSSASWHAISSCDRSAHMDGSPCSA